MTPHFVALAMILFAIGAVGVLIRRNAIVVFMCIEMMLNAVNLIFVAFARHHGAQSGHIIVFLVMAVAAAEVALGLAIIITVFRERALLNVDELRDMHG